MHARRSNIKLLHILPYLSPTTAIQRCPQHCAPCAPDWPMTRILEKQRLSNLEPSRTHWPYVHRPQKDRWIRWIRSKPWRLSHTFPYFPILSHTFPYFPILSLQKWISICNMVLFYPFRFFSLRSTVFSPKWAVYWPLRLKPWAPLSSEANFATSSRDAPQPSEPSEPRWPNLASSAWHRSHSSGSSGQCYPLNEFASHFAIFTYTMQSTFHVTLTVRLFRDFTCAFHARCITLHRNCSLRHAKQSRKRPCTANPTTQPTQADRECQYVSMPWEGHFRCHLRPAVADF